MSRLRRVGSGREAGCFREVAWRAFRGGRQRLEYCDEINVWERGSKIDTKEAERGGDG